MKNSKSQIRRLHELHAYVAPVTNKSTRPLSANLRHPTLLPFQNDTGELFERKSEDISTDMIVFLKHDQLIQTRSFIETFKLALNFANCYVEFTCSTLLSLRCMH